MFHNTPCGYLSVHVQYYSYVASWIGVSDMCEFEMCVIEHLKSYRVIIYSTLKEAYIIV